MDLCYINDNNVYNRQENKQTENVAMEKFYLGIDVGSTTVKAALVDSYGMIRHTLYQRTRPIDSGRVRCMGTCSRCGACNFGQLRQVVDRFLVEAGVLKSFEEIACTVVTGSQIVEDTHDFIPFDFQVSEVTAHVAGARYFHPDVKAILDVGGQDSKSMVYNESMKMWNYKMSGICAAGTGAFLDSVALKLGVPVEEMADRVDYDTKLEFSSVCAVLSATSINKFKNRFPLGEIIGGACRAQARTIMSGVGQLFFGYKGPIMFQGGVAYNHAVAHYLEEITGNPIVTPKYNGVMGALGAACLAREFMNLKGNLKSWTTEVPAMRHLESANLRSRTTRLDFLGHDDDKPMVWRNLFFPSEILNALGVRALTLETYAALFARNSRRVKTNFDHAACKGFSAETCSFLRVLEGMNLPKPACCVSTSQPCQQGERIFRDLMRSNGGDELFFSLQTPPDATGNSVEHLAADLEASVAFLEKTTGLKMDAGRLAEACELSNQARDYSFMCNQVRYQSPPLIRGGQAIYYAAIFSQLWGRAEMVDIQKQFYDELCRIRDGIGDSVKREDTHRLLWLHLPPFYDSTLLDFVELTCHAPIVFEEVNYIGWSKLDPKDPYRSLARKVLTTGFMDPTVRVKAILEQSRGMGINGCILYNHGFGRCSMSDSSFVKYLHEELSKENIPLLVLDGDCMDASTDPCSTYTKVSAYVEALNEKKFGNIFGPLKK